VKRGKEHQLRTAHLFRVNLPKQLA